MCPFGHHIFKAPNPKNSAVGHKNLQQQHIITEQVIMPPLQNPSPQDLKQLHWNKMFTTEAQNSTALYL